MQSVIKTLHEFHKIIEIFTTISKLSLILLAPVKYGTPIFFIEYSEGSKSVPEVKEMTLEKLVLIQFDGKFS